MVREGGDGREGVSPSRTLRSLDPEVVRGYWRARDDRREGTRGPVWAYHERISGVQPINQCPSFKCDF